MNRWSFLALALLGLAACKAEPGRRSSEYDGGVVRADGSLGVPPMTPHNVTPGIPGREARHSLEDAIDRFCECGGWPEDACPPYRANEDELACLDNLSQVTMAYDAYNHCVTSAGTDLDACAAEDAAQTCDSCRGTWALRVTECNELLTPNMKMVLDECITGR